MSDERGGTDAVSPETHALLAALASAFTAPDGRPVPVERRALTAAELAGLHREDGEAVLVPDAAQLAALLPGATAALVVLDGDGALNGDGTAAPEAVALVTRAPVGRSHLLAAEAVAAATGGLRRAVGALRTEAAVIDALHSVGRRLTAQLDIGRLVQRDDQIRGARHGARRGSPGCHARTGRRRGARNRRRSCRGRRRIRIPARTRTRR